MTPDEFLREYAASGRTGGVEKTLGMVDERAVYWFSDGSAHVGRAAVERALRRNAESIRDETYRISDVVWLLATADAAACAYRFDWSGTVGGAPASGAGRGTCVLARRGAAWVVVHEHLSRGATGHVPPASPPS